MRRISLVLVLFFVCSGSAMGYCGPPRLVCAEYAHSDAVVEAKLVRMQHFFPKNDDRQDWFVYTLALTKTYKGQIEQEFRIHEENDSGRAGFDWRKGESYLLFLRKSDDGAWWLSGCGNSDNLRKAGRTTEVINSLRTRDGGLIQGSVSGIPVGPNRLKIRVESKDSKQTFEGRVNENNLFRVHVPAGNYRVIVLLNGWTFERDIFMSYEDPADVHIENGWCAQLAFEAKSKSATP